MGMFRSEIMKSIFMREKQANKLKQHFKKCNIPVTDFYPRIRKNGEIVIQYITGFSTGLYYRKIQYALKKFNLI